MHRPKNLRAEPQAQALPLSQNFAKTFEEADGEKVLGQTVEEHCRIVGLVAEALAALYPDALRQRWFKNVGLTAALHDVGKVSPTFQEKIREGTTSYRPNSEKGLEHVRPEDEHRWGGHAGVSMLSLREFPGASEKVAEIAGSHHGFCPETLLHDGDEPLGGIPWKRARHELIEKLRNRFAENFPSVTTDDQARVLAGLTSVADWIGSGDSLSKTIPHDESAVARAVKESGFHKAAFKAGLSFDAVFGFSPNAPQKAFIDAFHGPGVYVLEAEMGSGKTEAALYAAYLAISRGDAGGLYFALPTQATSDAVYLRIQKFLQTVSQEAEPLLLTHSNACLSLMQMGADAAPGGAWFNSSKRSILGNFAVGTVDQALMAVMSVRHGFVRTFGLVGKVVILDEVHSYDVYTGTILNVLVQTLRRMGCVVIILSATLSRSRRNALLKTDLQCDKYPLITTVGETDGEKAVEIPVAALGSKEVRLRHVRHDDEAFEHALRCAGEGQRVLWIENTVDAAQKCFARFQSLLESAEKAPRLELLHSRFTRADRTANEQFWVNLYGKKGRQQQSGTGMILIGTQVLEQSLDIDADFLVTRLCPTDMLLQRLGRLWRHRESLRPASARCEAWVLEPELAAAIANPKEAFGASGIVYAPYVLLRTLQAWEKIDTVALPGDIRSLINATYDDRKEQGVFERLQEEMRTGTVIYGIKRPGSDDLENFARLSLAQNMHQSDDDVSTRFGEVPSADVLLVRSLNEKTVVLFDGTAIAVRSEDKTAFSARNAAAVQKNCVRVPFYLAPSAPDVRDIAWLKGLTFISSSEQARIRVVCVKENGFCEPLCGSAYKNCTAFYDKTGFRTQKHT